MLHRVGKLVNQTKKSIHRSVKYVLNHVNNGEVEEDKGINKLTSYRGESWKKDNGGKCRDRWWTGKRASSATTFGLSMSHGCDCYYFSGSDAVCGC